MAAFSFPLPPGTYSWGQPFGNNGHPGVDFPAGAGTPVLAPQAGRYHRSDGGGYGNSITLDTGAGFWRLAHFSRHAALIDGATVPAGTVVGYVGTTGHSTGNHLHIEWHPGGGSPVDPAPMLKTFEAGNATGLGIGIGATAGATTTSATVAGLEVPDLSGLGAFFQALTDGKTWLRVLEVAGGLALALGGIAVIKRDTIAGVATKATKAVATDGASLAGDAAGAAAKAAS